MRVLHLVDRLTDRGGAYRHLLAVAEAQTQSGHEVAFGAGSVELAAPGVPVHVEPALASRTRGAADFDRLVEAARPDIVHLHTILNPDALEWAVGRGALITVQDHRYFCPTRGKWTLLGRPCETAMDRQACAACFEDAGYFDEVFELTAARFRALRGLRVVVLSDYMRRELGALGVTAQVVPPFVHGLDESIPADGPPCVAFVGQLSPRKGAMDAVLAWRRSGVALPLVMAGAGPLREALERSGAVVPGWLDRRPLSALLRRARALMMPSRWQEPFGIAGLEALHLGVPVVAYDSGGVREWHPGPGLVAWGDVDALAAALANAVERRAMPATGFEREPLMRRLDELYSEACVRQSSA